MAEEFARRPSLVVLLVVVAATLLGAVFAAVHFERHAVATDLDTQRDLHGAAHAGSLACRRCHEDHYRSWHRTFHRTMTQDASAANAAAVLGDFSGVTLRHDGVDAHMDRDPSGSFRITFTAVAQPAAPPVVALVTRAVGSRRYQQYLTRVGDAEYRLPVAFHVEEKRWFHMNGAFLFPSSDASSTASSVASSTASSTASSAASSAEDDARGAPALAVDAPPAQGVPRFGGGDYDRHVTRWNDNCVFCHNVAANPGRDQVGGGFRTRVAEMGIACEACHGPGAQHVRANGDPVRRYWLHLSGRADPTIVNPARLSPARSADLCGRCHGQRITDDIARFLDHGDPFVPGDDLGLYSVPLWQSTSMGQQPAPFAARFWADGTARLTAYEYQGLLQSRCAQQGNLTCTSCHGMHEGDPRGQLRPAAAGDAACTACHRDLVSDAKKARHTHHQVTGQGARCVACHMPRIVYGVLDIHRSHRIEVPDPARAAAFDRPDACTSCHADQTQGWAAAAVDRLWGRAVGRTTDGARDRADLAAAGPLVKVLSGDPIERAVAADALGARDVGAAGALDTASRAVRAGMLLEVMTGDQYPAVRHLAWRALGRLLSPAPPALASYDPTGTQAQRRAIADGVVRVLPAGAVVVPDRAAVDDLRRRSQAVAIEIGE